MTEHTWQIGKVQIVVSPSSKVLKIVLVVLLVVSAAAMGTLHWLNGAIQDQTELYRRQAAALEYQNAVLEDKLENMTTVQGMLEIAKEELGLVSPDTILFQMQ